MRIAATPSKTTPPTARLNYCLTPHKLLAEILPNLYTSTGWLIFLMLQR